MSEGAEFTHVGSKVTFEVLVSSFNLGQDAGLTRLGVLVHRLDVGGIPIAEAPASRPLWPEPARFSATMTIC
jgi:hypothetical protein